MSRRDQKSFIVPPSMKGLMIGCLGLNSGEKEAIMAKIVVFHSAQQTTDLRLSVDALEHAMSLHNPPSNVVLNNAGAAWLSSSFSSLSPIHSYSSWSIEYPQCSGIFRRNELKLEFQFLLKIGHFCSVESLVLKMPHCALMPNKGSHHEYMIC